MIYKILHNLIKPSFILSVYPKLIGAGSVLGLSLLIYGLYLAFWNSPADYQQGETVRIMYIHVPASWWALSTYAVMTVLSFIGILRRIDLCHYLTKALAPTGLCFTFISLTTGSIWGKPTWGTWWEWDARLTSMLILLFIYIGYISFINAFDQKLKGLRMGALLILVGAFNLPIIKWSVNWWNTLHQPAGIIQFNRSSSVHPSMLKPLIIMALAFVCYGFVLTLINFKYELQKLKANSLGDKLTAG